MNNIQLDIISDLPLEKVTAAGLWSLVLVTLVLLFCWRVIKNNNNDKNK
jgi:hypothetical protein